jgi:hypothetical protein
VDDVGEVVGLEVGDVVGDDDVGVELEEDPVYSFNTLLNGVDVGVLVDVDVGVELEEVFNTLLNSVDIEELVDEEVELCELVDDEEDGVGTGDEVGDVVELFCELGCELADEDGVELDGVDVGVLVDDVDEEVELCELALWLLDVDVEELVDDEDDGVEDEGVELVGVGVGEDGVEDEGVELCELVDVEEEVELLLCELALSMVFIASLRNCV